LELQTSDFEPAAESAPETPSKIMMDQVKVVLLLSGPRGYNDYFPECWVRVLDLLNGKIKRSILLLTTRIMSAF
jgi:hypothetical protein